MSHCLIATDILLIIPVPLHCFNPIPCSLVPRPPWWGGGEERPGNEARFNVAVNS